MNARVLDEVLRRLGQGLSRRAAVHIWLKTSIASIAASLGLAGEADAKKRQPPSDQPLPRPHQPENRAKRNAKDRNTRANRDRQRDPGPNRQKRKDHRVTIEKKGKGGTCKKDRQCLSGNCQGAHGRRHKGHCGPSRPGHKCRRDDDCIAGASCVGGTCGFTS